MIRKATYCKAEITTRESGHPVQRKLFQFPFLTYPPFHKWGLLFHIWFFFFFFLSQQIDVYLFLLHAYIKAYIHFHICVQHNKSRYRVYLYIVFLRFSLIFYICSLFITDWVTKRTGENEMDIEKNNKQVKRTLAVLKKRAAMYDFRLK